MNTQIYHIIWSELNKTRSGGGYYFQMSAQKAEEQKLGFNEKVTPQEDFSLYMFKLYYSDKSSFISK